jgi:hypothetical protein
VPAKKSSKLNPPALLEIGSRSARGRTREDARFTAPPRAVLAANPIVIEAYWHTGKIILQRQQEAALGAKVIDRLSTDLRDAFPDMRGLSTRNLLAMKIFARGLQLRNNLLRNCPGAIHRRRGLENPTQ